MPVPEGLISVNVFGFGGANAMVILRPFKERKQILNTASHRLVHVSGRSEEGVKVMLEAAIKHKANAQFLALVDNIFKNPIDNHNYRGYAILSNDSHMQVSQTSTRKRPVWFVYSGFGAQYPGMGKDMMKHEVFRNTIKKCAAALKPNGVDLEDIIMNGTEDTFNNLINTFTSITAISVALTDVLASLNIQPAGIIGHSLGEVGTYFYILILQYT